MSARVAAIASAGLLMLTACAGDDDSSGAVPTTIDATTTTTAAPPTTERPTTTTTTAPRRKSPKPTTTTAAPTTTAPPLPRPIDSPTDAEADEPVIELGTISIPKIGIERTMYDGIRLTTLDRGPGHWPGTAMPGEVGNVVVAGHRVSHNADFHDIDHLVAGDEVTFTTNDGKTFTYVVDKTDVVGPEDTWIVSQTPAKTATLFACHPPGSTQYRYVVHLALSA